MDKYFEWFGVAILMMLSIISGYKILKQKTVTKNQITLFIVTVLSTLILFGIRPEVLEFFGFKGKFSTRISENPLDSIQVFLPTTNVILEIDPVKPEFWTTDSNFIFKWYNAPYGLAIDLGEMNIDNLNNKKVTYQFLLFEGNEDSGREEFKNRYKRMKEFLLYMENHNTPLENRVEVRILRNKRFPSISIYLFKKRGEQVANFYLDPLINKGGKTYKAFQTYSESVVNFLDKEFEDSWAIADTISLKTLLGK